MTRTRYTGSLGGASKPLSFTTLPIGGTQVIAVVRARRLAESLLCAVVLLGAAPGATYAQDLMPRCDDGFDLTLAAGPTLNSAPTFAERFGGEVEASLCATGVNELFGREGWHGLALGGRALLADHDVITPDASEARATLLVGVAFFDVGDVTIDIEEDPTPGGLVTSYGWVELGATAAYEESVDRSERGFTAGGVLRYGHERKAWVPSLSLGYAYVRPTSSAARRAAGLDEEDAHGRFSADLYWNFRLRFVSTALEDFSLGADLSYFRTNGLDPDLVTLDGDWESGALGAATIRWNGDVAIAGGLALRGIYVRYAAGHKGTDGAETDGFRAGVDVSFNTGSGG